MLIFAGFTRLVGPNFWRRHVVDVWRGPYQCFDCRKESCKGCTHLQTKEDDDGN